MPRATLNPVAPFPHAARDNSYSVVTSTRQSALWLLLGFVLLLAGLAAFMASPKLGIMALGLPALPLLVLFPPQALMLVIALVPFDAVASLGPPRSTTITKLVAVAVIAGWVVHLLIRRQRLRMGGPALLLVAYVAFAAASSIWAEDRAATFHRLQLLVQLLILYIMVVNLITSPTLLERSLNVLLASSVVVAGLFLWHLPSETLGPGRATLALGERAYNPDGLAKTLVFPAIAAVALGRAASFPRWWRFASLVPVGIAVLLTAARGAGLALLAGLVFLALMRPRLGIRISGFILAGVIALMLVAPKGYLERIEQRYAGAAEDRGSGRLDIWAVGMTMIRDRPFQGTGFGGFQPAFYRYMAETTLDPRWAAANSAGRRVPHNTYLNSLAELGIFGAGIFYAALVAHCACVLHAFRSSRHAGNLQGVNLSLAILGMLVALLVTGLTGDFALAKISWLVLALCQGAGLLLSPTSVKSWAP